MSNDKLVGQFDFHLTQDILNYVRVTGQPYETQVREQDTGRALVGAIFLDKSDAAEDIVRLKVSVYNNQNVSSNGNSSGAGLNTEDQNIQTERSSSNEQTSQTERSSSNEQTSQTERSSSNEQTSQTTHSGDLPGVNSQETRVSQTDHSGELGPERPTEHQGLQAGGSPGTDQATHTLDLQSQEARLAQTEHSGDLGPDRPTEHQSLQTESSHKLEQVSQTEHIGEIPLPPPPPVESQEYGIQTVDQTPVVDEMFTQTETVQAFAQSIQTEVAQLDSSAIQTEFLGTDQWNQTEEKEEYEQVTQTDPTEQGDNFSQTEIKTYEDYFSQTEIELEDDEVQTDVNETFEMEVQTEELEMFEQEVQTFNPPLKDSHMQTIIKEYGETESQTIIKVFSETDMQTENNPLVDGVMQTDIAEIQETGFQTELEMNDCDMQTDPTPLTDQISQTIATPLLEQECQTEVEVQHTEMQTVIKEYLENATQFDLVCEDQVSQTESPVLVELESQTDSTPLAETSVQTEIEPGLDQVCQTTDVKIVEAVDLDNGATQTDLVWVQNLQITTCAGPSVELGFASPSRDPDESNKEDQSMEGQAVDGEKAAECKSEADKIPEPCEPNEKETKDEIAAPPVPDAVPPVAAHEIAPIPQGAQLEQSNPEQVPAPGLPPLEPPEFPGSEQPEKKYVEGSVTGMAIIGPDGEARIAEEKFVQTDPVTIIIGDASFLVQKLQQGEEISPRRGPSPGAARKPRRRRTQAEMMMIKKESQGKFEETGDEPPKLSLPENIANEELNKEMPVLNAMDEEEQKPYIPRKYGRTAVPLKREKPNYSPLKFRYPTMRSDDGLKPNVVVGQFNCPYCAENFNDSATLYQHLHANHDAPRATNKRKRRSRNVIVIDTLDDENMSEQVVGYVEAQGEAGEEIQTQIVQNSDGTGLQTVEVVNENGTGEAEGPEEECHVADNESSVSGKRAFTCPFCPKMFGKSSALYVHLQSSHKAGNRGNRRAPERSRLKIVGGNFESNEEGVVEQVMTYHGNVKREQHSEEDEFEEEEQQIQLEFVSGEEPPALPQQQQVTQPHQENAPEEEQPPPQQTEQQEEQQEQQEQQQEQQEPEPEPEAEPEPAQQVEEEKTVQPAAQTQEEDEEEEEILDQGEPFPEDDEDDVESTGEPAASDAEEKGKVEEKPAEEEEEQEEEEPEPVDEDALPLRGSRRRSMAVGDKVIVPPKTKTAEKTEKKDDKPGRRTRSGSLSSPPTTRSPSARIPSKRKREAMEETASPSGRKVYQTRGAIPAKRGRKSTR